MLIPIVWSSNEHLDPPKKVLVIFTPGEMLKLKKHAQYAIDNDVTIEYSVNNELPEYNEQEQAEDEDFNNFYIGRSYLKLGPDGEMFYQAFDVNCNSIESSWFSFSGFKPVEEWVFET